MLPRFLITAADRLREEEFNLNWSKLLMGRYTGPKYKLSRRERQDLFLKVLNALMGKSPLEKKNYPPGEHGQSQAAKNF